MFTNTSVCDHGNNRNYHKKKRKDKDKTGAGVTEGVFSPLTTREQVGQ